jgi:hypothetical protein
MVADKSYGSQRSAGNSVVVLSSAHHNVQVSLFTQLSELLMSQYHTSLAHITTSPLLLLLHTTATVTTAPCTQASEKEPAVKAL